MRYNAIDTNSIATTELQIWNAWVRQNRNKQKQYFRMQPKKSTTDDDDVRRELKQINWNEFMQLENCGHVHESKPNKIHFILLLCKFAIEKWNIFLSFAHFMIVYSQEIHFENSERKSVDDFMNFALKMHTTVGLQIKFN